MISGESDFQTELKPHEQIDILKNNGRKIIQNKEKFMFGIDAYLLAGFSEIRKGDIVVEFGTGTGIIPILLADSPAKKIHALEVQPESVSMARRSVELNELSEKIQIHEGNLKNASQIFSKSFKTYWSDLYNVQDKTRTFNVAKDHEPLARRSQLATNSS